MLKKKAKSKGLIRKKIYSCCFLKPENGRRKVNIVLSNIAFDSKDAFLNFNFNVKEGSNSFSYKYKLPQNIIKLCFVGNEECGKEYFIDKDGHIDFGQHEEVFKNMEQKDNPLIIFYKMLKNTDFPRAKTKPNGRRI